MQRDNLAKIRWAPRVNPRLIRRLYETDASGIVDEELIDEAGCALLSRCESILEVSEAHYQGRVRCPECGQTVIRAGGARSRLPITCICGWSVPWLDYPRTYQGKHLAAEVQSQCTGPLCATSVVPERLGLRCWPSTR